MHALAGFPRLRKFMTLGAAVCAAALTACLPADEDNLPDPDPACLLTDIPGLTFKFDDASGQFVPRTYIGADGITEMRYNWEQATYNPETAPLIVFIHGGTWKDGNQDAYSNVLYTRHLVSREFLKHFNIASIDYRHWNGDHAASPNTWVHPAQRNDVIAFIDQIDELEGVANDRVCLIGHSSGGHTAASIAVNPVIWGEYSPAWANHPRFAGGWRSPFEGVDISSQLKCIISFGGIYLLGAESKPGMAEAFRNNHPDRPIPSDFDPYLMITPEYSVQTMLLGESLGNSQDALLPGGLTIIGGVGGTRWPWGDFRHQDQKNYNDLIRNVTQADPPVSVYNEMYLAEPMKVVDENGQLVLDGNGKPIPQDNDGDGNPDIPEVPGDSFALHIGPIFGPSQTYPCHQTKWRSKLDVNDQVVTDGNGDPVPYFDTLNFDAGEKPVYQRLRQPDYIGGRGIQGPDTYAAQQAHQVFKGPYMFELDGNGQQIVGAWGGYARQVINFIADATGMQAVHQQVMADLGVTSETDAPLYPPIR